MQGNQNYFRILVPQFPLGERTSPSLLGTYAESTGNSAVSSPSDGRELASVGVAWHGVADAHLNTHESEIWLPAPLGVESVYDVSDLGRCRNRRTGRMMRANANVDSGYLYLSLHIGSVHKKPRLHVLVAKAFIPNPLGLPQVNHINTIKTDCRADNLEWMTNDQNMEHAKANGLIWSGAKINTAKLTDEKVSEVLELHRDGMSTRELSKKYGLRDSSIQRIVKGETWKHITRVPLASSPLPLLPDAKEER